MYAAMILFHILFFWEVYTKPYTLATSELISTFFPSWLHLNGKPKKSDPYYWINYHGHALLGAYYPPNLLTSWIGNRISLNNAFKLQVYTILAHVLGSSFAWYLLLRASFSIEVALFGAITFSYCAVMQRYVQPYVVQTLAWLPVALMPQFGFLGVGMMLLAGYYPYALYLLPIVFIINPWSMFGVILASPQLIAFFKYMPKTIKWKKAEKLDCGYWEYGWYFGILPLFLVYQYIPFVILYAISVYLLREKLPRVPERAFLPMIYMLIFFSLFSLTKNVWVAIILQCFDLWLINRKKCPFRPYTELYNQPKWAFNNKLTRFLSTNLGNDRVSGLPFPLQTGHINKFHTLGYCGGMANKLMAKFRKDSNPNGSGNHDWFKENDDTRELDRYRVKYSWTTKRLDWKPTSVKYLWCNPRYKAL